VNLAVIDIAQGNALHCLRIETQAKREQLGPKPPAWRFIERWRWHRAHDVIDEEHDDQRMRILFGRAK